MDTFWLSCLEHFEKELSAQQFNTWIKPLRLEVSHNPHEPAAVVIAPNRFVMQWVKDNFLSRIEQMAGLYFPHEIRFQLKLADPISVKTIVRATENTDAALQAETPSPNPAAFGVPVVLAQKFAMDAREKREKNPSRLNSSFTL